MRTNIKSDLLNADGLDESITKDYYSVDGGDGNEDVTDYEGEESEVGGVPPQDLPKFRTLVRDKKLQLKAQWGKGRFKNESYTTRECKKVFGRDVCINVPKIRVVWVSGWRKKWREFKQSGGLAQLKIQSITPVSVNPSTNPIPVGNPTVGTDNVIPISQIPRFTKSGSVINAIDSALVNVKTEESNTQEAPIGRPNTYAQGKPDSTQQGKPSTNLEDSELTSGEKFLGMPKNIGIAVTVVGAIAIGFTAFKLLKK